MGGINGLRCLQLKRREPRGKQRHTKTMMSMKSICGAKIDNQYVPLRDEGRVEKRCGSARTDEGRKSDEGQR